MLEDIKNLLILQDRDRKLLKVKDELLRIPHERKDIESRNDGANAALDKAKLHVNQLESERKELELQVASKKSLIEKYSVQQFQTKKNEEFRALGKEIATCKSQILKIEDGQLDLMERIEAGEKVIKEAAKMAKETGKTTTSHLADLGDREANLQKELAELEEERAGLAEKVDSDIRNKYERLLKHKGNSVVVGIQHGVCGGCHMQLSRQTMVSCQAQQEIISCINCGRILYYSPDMDLALSD
jgi:predicted  nucleic acid-binding Zn-ribbon protein